MQSCNSDIIDADDAVAEHLCGECGFLCNGDVAGASGGDNDRALCGDMLPAVDDADARRFIVEERKPPGQIGSRFRRKAGNQNIFRAVGEKALGDALNLLLCLGRAVDDLRRPLPDFPVMIDLRVAQILKRGEL